jgi:hypothetical protein
LQIFSFEARIENILLKYMMTAWNSCNRLGEQICGVKMLRNGLTPAQNSPELIILAGFCIRSQDWKYFVKVLDDSLE